MRRYVFLLLLLMLIMPIAQAAPEGDYILRPDDAVSIHIFGYPDLSYPSQPNPYSLTIRPDGKITYPFLGEIKAEGMSPQALAQLIFEQLGSYYVNPRVTVNVVHFSTERVYVVGEVNQPGLYELDKSRNLMDALGAAKGWTKDAAKTKVFIIHKDHQGEPLRVNLMDLLKKGDVTKNIRLQEGDIVYLTQNHRIDIANDILPLTAIFYNLRYVGAYGGALPK